MRPLTQNHPQLKTEPTLQTGLLNNLSLKSTLIFLLDACITATGNKTLRKGCCQTESEQGQNTWASKFSHVHECYAR